MLKRVLDFGHWTLEFVLRQAQDGESFDSELRTVELLVEPFGVWILEFGASNISHSFVTRSELLLIVRVG
jgi:hypothetical protein